jgi:hypothetical protein
MAVGLTGLVSGTARADVRPQGCLSNSLDLTLTKDKLTVRNGDVVNFTLSIANTKDTPCDVSDAVIKVTLPGPTGEANGTVVPIGTIEVPAGAVLPRYKTIPWTVQLNPGVTVATAEATSDGKLHDVAVGLRDVHVAKTLGTGAVQPGLALTKTASTPSGLAPLGVTYTYVVTNISTTPESIGPLALTDNLCSPLSPAAGDGNANGLIDPGETFTYTCTTTHQNPGTYVNTATVCGQNVNDQREVCAPPATATVVVTVPVRSASERCISIPKKLSVRANELTTVKVTVTDGLIKGASIKLSGAGIQRTGKTNSKGQATFKVRPTKKGTLTISSSSCLEAARVSVKGARQTQSRQVPRNTG